MTTEPMNKVEKQRWEKFGKEHYDCCGKGACVGVNSYWYRVRQTSIVPIITASCDYGVEIDISDIESW